MAELKTKLTDQDPEEFLATIEPEEKRKDAFALLELFEKVTGEKGKMWGSSIVGFGKYHYKSNSSEGDWMRVGFSPRKQNLTLYILAWKNHDEDSFQKLGKYKTGGGCLYINKLTDVNLSVLTKMIENSYNGEKMNEV